MHLPTPLLEKKWISNIGIRGLAPNLFKSYFHNRKQKVIVDEAVSDASIIKCGVPY